MGTEKPPFHIQLHLTDKCNLKCRHCYEGERKAINEWDYDDLLHLISDFELAFEKWDVAGEFSLVGGEPTMYPYLSQLLYRLSGSQTITRFAILTNGVNLSDEIKKAILDTSPTVQISVDGIDADHHDYIRGAGNYAKAISTIQWLKAHGVSVFVHYVLSKNTVPITWEFISTMDSLGVDQITFSRVVPIGSSDLSALLSADELRKVFSDLNDFGEKLRANNSNLVINSARPLWCLLGEGGRCPAGIQTLTILPDGTALPCRRLPIPVGNVKHDSIFSIWYNSPVLWNLRDRSAIKVCGDCEHLESCGGARCIAYAVSNDYMGADPQCWLTEKT